MSIATIRRFLDMIPILSRGRFVERLDAELATVMEALAETEKATATMTVTIKFTRLGDRIDVQPKVVAKLPEEEPYGATPFWEVDGALSVQHPSQADMFAGPRPVSARDSA